MADGWTFIDARTVMLISCPQVLAVDLLNPSPAAEAKKHKLKV